MTAELKAAQLESDIAALRAFAAERDTIILDRQLPALKASAANVFAALDQAAEARDEAIEALDHEKLANAELFGMVCQAAEALKPFAHYYALNDLHERPDADVIEVPIGDLRRAATVYATLKPEGEQ